MVPVRRGASPGLQLARANLLLCHSGCLFFHPGPGSAPALRRSGTGPGVSTTSDYMAEITLKGITWGHSRGITPLLAAAQRYSELHPEIEITWSKRTLQAFADYP